MIKDLYTIITYTKLKFKELMLINLIIFKNNKLPTM